MALVIRLILFLWLHGTEMDARLNGGALSFWPYGIPLLNVWYQYANACQASYAPLSETHDSTLSLVGFTDTFYQVC